MFVFPRTLLRAALRTLGITLMLSCSFAFADQETTVTVIPEKGTSQHVVEVSATVEKTKTVASADASVPANAEGKKGLVEEKTTSTAEQNIKPQSTKSSSALSTGLHTPGGLLQWLLSTVGVLGVIFFLAYILKKSRFVQRSVGTMRVEGQLSLGPKERIVKVEVDGQRLLLGVTASNINLLKELDSVEAMQHHTSSTAASGFFKKKEPAVKEAAPSINEATSTTPPAETVVQMDDKGVIEAEPTKKATSAPESPSLEEVQSFEELLAKVQQEQTNTALANASAPVESKTIEPEPASLVQKQTVTSDSAPVSMSAKDRRAARRKAAKAQKQAKWQQQNQKIHCLPEDDVLAKRSERLHREMQQAELADLREKELEELQKLVDLQQEYAKTVSVAKGEK